MLEININRKRPSETYTTLNIDNLSLDNSDVIVKSKKHNLVDGDDVMLERLADGVYFSENRNVTVLNDDEFNIGSFPDQYVDVISCEKLDYPYYIDENGNTSYKKAVVYRTGEQHNLIKKRPYSSINEVITEDYYDLPTTTIRRCTGDFVVFNGIVYESNSFKDDGKYILDKDIKNCPAVMKFRIEDDVYADIDCIVPCNNDGSYDRNTLIAFYNSENEEALDQSLSAYGVDRFTAKDERFFIINDDEVSLIMDNGVSETFIYKNNNSFKIAIPFHEDMTVNTFKDFSIQQWMEKRKNESINAIIDYEKKEFCPVFVNDSSYDAAKNPVPDDSKLERVQDIEFNLHLRERENFDEDTSNTDSEEGKKLWTTRDGLYWNNYGVTKDAQGYSHLDNITNKGNLSPSDGDLLSFLGITDDDVYYQRKGLSESFIRILIYDSPDRATQTLQFYSTVFLDSGKFFSKYIAAKGSQKHTDNITSMEFNSDAEDREKYRLGTAFSTSNKYNMSESSDGFYLHLFDSLVKGNGVTALYMKVEFNNAVYGRTVSMTLPVDDNCIPYDVKSTKFPIHYMLPDSNGEYTKVSKKRLDRDLYIKIFVKYDFDRHQFVWFLPRKADKYNGLDNGKLIFNLFEPRVNGYETRELDTIETDNTGDTGGGEYKIDINTRLENYLYNAGVLYTMSFNGITVFNNRMVKNLSTERGSSTSDDVKVTGFSFGGTDKSNINVYVRAQVVFHNAIKDSNGFCVTVYNYSGSYISHEFFEKHTYAGSLEINVTVPLTKLVSPPTAKSMTMYIYVQYANKDSKTGKWEIVR